MIKIKISVVDDRSDYEKKSEYEVPSINAFAVIRMMDKLAEAFFEMEMSTHALPKEYRE